MSETLRDHTLAWLDSIGADGLFNEDFPDCEISKDALRSLMGILADAVPAYRHADGTYHTEKEVPKAASVCIHGSGNCLGVKNCMGAFADCLDREKAASQSAELELASIAFNARMNTPDGYAKMIAEFKAFLEVERDAQRQAGREEAMADYEKVSASRLALVRELDVALNGENAAIQASLCDIVAQVKRDGLASAIRSALEAAADRFCETYCCIAPLDCLKKHKSCYLRKAIIAPIQETSKALSDLEAQVKL